MRVWMWASTCTYITHMCTEFIHYIILIGTQKETYLGILFNESHRLCRCIEGKDSTIMVWNSLWTNNIIINCYKFRFLIACLSHGHLNFCHASCQKNSVNVLYCQTTDALTSILDKLTTYARLLIRDHFQLGKLTYACLLIRDHFKLGKLTYICLLCVEFQKVCLFTFKFNVIVGLLITFNLI